MSYPFSGHRSHFLKPNKTPLRRYNIFFSVITWPIPMLQMLISYSHMSVVLWKKSKPQPDLTHTLHDPATTTRLSLTGKGGSVKGLSSAHVTHNPGSRGSHPGKGSLRGFTNPLETNLQQQKHQEKVMRSKRKVSPIYSRDGGIFGVSWGRSTYMY